MGVREKLGAERGILAPTAVDATSNVCNVRGADGVRFILNAGVGVTNVDFQCEASPNGVDRWYTLGPVITLTAAGTTSIWFDEPNSFVRVDASAVAGGLVDAGLQVYD